MSMVLALKHITKVFPGVKSLDDVNFELKKGEVHALIGENGAGKSTLMKVMAGIYQPEEGDIIYKNQTVRWKNPLHARTNGISVIHQELQLAKNLSIAENIMMGKSLPKNKFQLVDWNQMNKRAKQLLVQIGSDLAPGTIVSTLSVAQQQIVEIARALSIQADVIIMDEPSATLTGKEIDKLFELIKMLKQQGVAIIYISHRMEEIFKIANRCTVLRDGKWIATKFTQDTNEDELVRLMVGRELSKEHAPEDPFFGSGTPLLEAINLSNGKTVKNAYVNVYQGEIVGIAGLVGAGRSEFLHLIFGSDKTVSGELKLNGKRISPKTPREAISHGISLVPESRKDQALFLQMGVGQNISSLKLKDFASMNWINHSSRRVMEQEYAERLNVKTASLTTPVENLSGGNQQKAIIAKWISTRPKVLLLDEPTRGVDVGAKAEIYGIIRDLLKTGIGVIVVSSDLSEILTLSNRVFVMKEGVMVAELLNHELAQETIMQHATGGKSL